MKNTEKNVIVFNRAMQWLDDRKGVQGGLIAYCSKESLRLTGKQQVASWFTPCDNEIKSPDNNYDRFIKKSSAIASVSLEGLEYPVEQYPELIMEVREADSSWRVDLCVGSVRYDRDLPLAIRGRLYQKTGDQPETLRVNIRELLRAQGYNTQYIRLSLSLTVLGQGPRSICYSAKMMAAQALVPQLPVIRSIHQAREGVTLSCVVLNDKAQRLHQRDCRVSVAVDGRTYSLNDMEQKGVFSCKVTRLKEGVTPVVFNAKLNDSSKMLKSATTIVINDGKFIRYDKRAKRYKQDGKILGFLSGSLMLAGGAPYLLNNGENMPIYGMKDYKAKAPSFNKSLSCVSWLTMPPSELVSWVDFFHKSGYRMVKIANWYPTLLDAGGRISPYGAEVLIGILNALGRNGMVCHLDIYHDMLGWSPGRHNHPLLDRYWEKGVRNLTDHGSRVDMWMSPPVANLLKGYFKHFLTLFKDDARILAFTTAGEGDQHIGPRYANQMHDFIRRFDKNHLITLDISCALPESEPEPRIDRGYLQEPGFKARHRRIMPVVHTGKYKSDHCVSANVKFYSLDPEGAYGEGDCNAYEPWTPGRPHNSSSANPFSEEYQLILRDALWLSLVNGLPLIHNWMEILREDEHLLPTIVSEKFNWTAFEPEVPKVFCRLGGGAVLPKGVETLVQYEEAFNKIPLNLGYVWGNDLYPDGRRSPHDEKNRRVYEVIEINMRDPNARFSAQKARFMSQGGCLPDSLKEFIPLEIPSGYSCNYLLSRNRNAMIAYIRNTTNYKKAPELQRTSLIRCGRRPVGFNLRIKNLEGKTYRLFDVDKREEIIKGKMKPVNEIKLGNTNHDFCLLIT